MRLTTQERLAQKPASKIAGVIYMMLGVFALFVAAFVVSMQGAVFGEVTSFRIGVAIVIALYGLFRIITGFITFRKANKGASITLNGKANVGK
jgi:succinate-acetate transporter protein